MKKKAGAGAHQRSAAWAADRAETVPKIPLPPPDPGYGKERSAIERQSHE